MIRVKDTGPIKIADIPTLPDGGVVVLRGPNGCGKSTALRAVESLIRGEGKLETRDDSKSPGTVDGFGAHLVIGRKTTRAGELEVQSLDGKLDVATLVDPQMKDPAAADRLRIKSLISITGVEPTQKQFETVIGAEMSQHVTAATWTAKDLLDVAAKAKRDLEAKARLVEDEAKMREGQAKGIIDAHKDVDLSGESDEQVLRDAHMKASNRVSVLKDREQAAIDAENSTYRAQQRLNKLKAEYKGPTVKEANGNLTDAQAVVFNAEAKVKDLRLQLDAANINLAEAEHVRDRAIDAKESATSHFATIAECESILNATGAQAPDQSDIDAADAELLTSANAVEQGAIVRRAKQELAKAEQHKRDALAATTLGEKLRQAAGQIDQVLSNAIQTPQLFVRDGRLYTNIFKRGASGDEPSLFNELSHGQRWRIAFEIAAPIVTKDALPGQLGVLIADGIWSALSPSMRDHVNDLAKEYRVLLLTTEPSDGELRAEVA